MKLVATYGEVIVHLSKTHNIPVENIQIADVTHCPDDFLSLIASGQKLMAIKAVREKWGLGLKEAKDIVDNFVMMVDRETAKKS